jgi:hypothetical protein
MTTTKTTADLLWCPTFRGFLQHWIDHKRPALEMVDYLLEMDYPNAAAAIQWAADTEDRKVYLAPSGEYSGVYPVIMNDIYYSWECRDNYPFADGLHWRPKGLSSASTQHKTLQEALIWMMDSCPWVIK